MNRFGTIVAALALATITPKSRGDNYVPYSYYRTLSHINTNHAHHKALYQVQMKMQQLIQLQTARALQGQGPTPAMLEQARRLALLAAYHEQGIQTTNGMIHQGRLESRQHYWEMMLRRALIP